MLDGKFRNYGRLLTTLMLTLAISLTSFAAELTLVGPAVRDHFVRVKSDESGRWVVFGPNNIFQMQTAFGSPLLNKREIITQDKECVFVGPPGAYAVMQFPPDGAQESYLVVTVLENPEPIPPGPGPGPDPPDPPEPDNDPPFPATALTVLIMEETADRGNLSREQREILDSPTIQLWLNTNCPNRWRILDDDIPAVELARSSKVWQDAFAVAKKGDKLPWIVISNGKKGTSEVLPANVQSTLELLDKYK